MPPLTQIVSEESVRQVAEDLAQENTVFRDAFRNISIPDRTGSTFDIPVPEDKLGEPTVREPGAEFDYGREEYDAVTLEREEYASGSRITEEEIADNSFALLEDHIDRHAQKMAEKLDAEAFEVLNAAATSAAPQDDVALPAGSDNGDDMTFEDVIKGMEVLESREGGYEGDILFVGTDAKNGIVRDLSDRGTELGDNTITGNGVVTNYAGVDIAFSNNNLLTDNDAILVDTEYFGYEGEWLPISTDQEEDFDSQSTKLQIRWKGDWVATQPEAAVRIRG
jgi:parallel beta-helix repeat protein